MSVHQIKPLDDDVIKRIRSSLIITSIPQCIRELICNAIDANATNIDISLDVEKFTVQVNDNGHGILDLSKIGQRHTSSKCHTLSDIQHLKTFGFRGEAMAAITNESLTQIISRHCSSNETFEGFWKDGHVIGEILPSKHMKKSCSGTRVILRDLFYKYPVRRKQITAYQHAAVIESVKRQIIGFALCFNYINFNLIDSHRNLSLLSIKKTSSSLNTFRQQFGQDITKHVEMLAMRKGDIVIDGFYSSQGYPSKAHQYIYINNYLVPVQNVLYRIVPSLFAASNFGKIADKRQYLEGKAKYTQRHPIYMTRLICPFWSNYDIHMYLEMFEEFPDYTKIADLIKALTIKFLIRSGNLSKDEPIQMAGQKRRRGKDSLFPPANTNQSSISHITNNPYLLHSPSLLSTPATSVQTASNAPDELCQLLKASSIDCSHLKRAKTPHHIEAATLNDNCTTSQLYQNLLSYRPLSYEMPQKLLKEDLLHSCVLGQIDRKYIATRSLKEENRIIIIDQHAADERVKLEQMMNVDIRSTIALEPVITLNMESIFEVEALMDQRMSYYFKNWGIQYLAASDLDREMDTQMQSRFFEITESSSPHFITSTATTTVVEKRYKIYVTHIPALVSDRCISNHALLKELIRDYMYWVMSQQNNEAVITSTCPKGIVDILKSRACRTAIMFNDELTLEQCGILIRNLAKCNFPFQCAHGRPSAVPVQITSSIPTAYSKRQKNWSKFTVHA
ncbi:hypothetical protein BDF20DRAFT_1002163 [Mycotypha africana]|uniref:uncharacterized protein n=1 Tax=Mycotypha africana TaxID=64632 RepID=UPI0023018872|nr:uncharacterized protein BDF20DRAFT_1002163 [Mycotypha africana]KAI8975742.1 hypothetical protein BDF20DRAFT_1002163 [Mycotypha africana]